MAPNADLNDLYYFAKVAEHGGFAAAARALDVSKSRLSRHVAALEAQVGLRLLQRSTRHFVITDVGQQMLAHCQTMLASAQAALEVAQVAHSAPRGRVRLAAPAEIASQYLAPLLPMFLARFPEVQLDIDVSNRRVDVLADAFDLALRVRTVPSGEDGLVMRQFAELDELLVAAPSYARQYGLPESPAELSGHAVMGFSGLHGELVWTLVDRDGECEDVRLGARLVAHSFPVLLQLALAGSGIVMLPKTVVQPMLDAGQLQRVLADWRLPQGVFHAVYPHRRGQLPAVRALLDFLVAEVPPMVAKVTAYGDSSRTNK